jgi:hypothetical protein
VETTPKPLENDTGLPNPTSEPRNKGEGGCALHGNGCCCCLSRPPQPWPDPALHSRWRRQPDSRAAGRVVLGPTLVRRGIRLATQMSGIAPRLLKGSRRVAGSWGGTSSGLRGDPSCAPSPHITTSPVSRRTASCCLPSRGRHTQGELRAGSFLREGEVQVHAIRGELPDLVDWRTPAEGGLSGNTTLKQPKHPPGFHRSPACSHSTYAHTSYITSPILCRGLW